MMNKAADYAGFLRALPFIVESMTPSGVRVRNRLICRYLAT